jgi:acetyl-CoA acetyltransferase
VYLECCKFCEEGEADKMLRDGETKIDGKLPTNLSGGFSSHGEAVAAQAIWQVIECANQLRGRSGERQVQKKMKIAMAQTYGLMGNSGTTIISL